MMNNERKLVFISHANPEDNTFTLWLASRLTSLGYLVWADVTQLFGAEKFWKDVEDAIRNHAAKVVVVLSRVSQDKEGVINEIHTALNVEKKNEFKRFVVPIKIDDLPSADIIAVLVQKNYINFHPNWAEGLNKLVTLLDKTHVPRIQSQTIYDTSRWFDELLSSPQKIVHEPQTVISNWLSVDLLPNDLNFYRVPINADKIESYFESFSYPVAAYRDMISTFASQEDVDSYLPDWHASTRAYKIRLQAVLNEESHNLNELKWPEASRMLNYLVRKAWDKTMRKKGLNMYGMANDRYAWHFADGYRDKNRTHYADINGVKRRRKLVGYSNMRGVYWHFAVAAYPFLGREFRLLLKTHVAFSEDGKRPLASVKRMHSLRRSFCRNWWNDRWRELLFAYISEISGGEKHIQLPVGSSQFIQVCSKPQLFESPVSVSGIDAAHTLEDESEEELDRLADSEHLNIDDYLDKSFDSEDIEYVEDGG